MSAETHTLIDELLAEQGNLSAVDRFSQRHSQDQLKTPRYRELMPASPPSARQQYSFEVDLDQCSGCKACVTACHSLNGLDDGESWRDVGQLVSRDESRPFHQTVTTACHHCLDPGCLNGCPVLAYEKDPATGIVHHLDDQCIGCQYCVLKCPYEVPKYSERLGIVRKCDMCSQRLAVGEAPACVQACPNEAITIALVDREQLRASLSQETAEFLAASPDPRLTLPTTRYLSTRGGASQLASNNFPEAKLQPAHGPLVILLVMTQLGVGAWCASLVAAVRLAEELRWVALVTTHLGLLASVPHLGQPVKAWRSFLGWRKSWMSREIIAFSAFAAAAMMAVLGPIAVPSLPSGAAPLQTLAGVIGCVAVFCSGMLYHDTGRPTWLGWRSVGRFLMTSLILGSGCGLFLAVKLGAPALGWSLVVTLSTGLKLALELKWLLPSKASRLEDGDEAAVAVSARLQRTTLRRLTWGRLVASALGGVLLSLVGWGSASLPVAGLGLLFLAIGEFGERSAFFRSMVARRMPGV